MGDKMGVIFSFKWTGPYTMHVTSERNHCSLINKAGKKLLGKYSISLLKQNLDSEEKEIACDENHPIS